MAIFTMCTIFYITLVIFDLVPIYRDKDKKSFYAYLIILILTYIIHILIIIGIKVPSPAEPIKNIITGIFGLPS